MTSRASFRKPWRGTRKAGQERRRPEGPARLTNGSSRRGPATCWVPSTLQFRVRVHAAEPGSVRCSAMHALFSALIRRGWVIRSRAAEQPLLPTAVARRYPLLPPEVIDILSSVDICHNPSETSWLLSAGDYARTSGPGFRWNEYECIALEAAADSLDRAAITGFWNTHFPFMLAVHSDYDFLAVRLTADRFSGRSFMAHRQSGKLRARSRRRFPHFSGTSPSPRASRSPSTRRICSCSHAPNLAVERT